MYITCECHHAQHIKEEPFQWYQEIVIHYLQIVQDIKMFRTFRFNKNNIFSKTQTNLVQM